MKRLFIALSFLFLPVAVHAAADLSISPGDIRFSSDVLVAGDEVRIYAKVYNVGDEDVSGYVSFYQGATLIDDSLVISLLADGSPEEVYIDFVVPEGSFNILALLRGTDPSDVSSSNDSALTSTYIPVVDNDRDGIDNEDDNCPDTSNNNQLDTDSDGQGDACDSDDDNDGLTDEVEAELNTNATQQDSDGDGVTDPNDAYPMDAERAVVEEETESVPEETAAPSSEAFQKIVEEVAKTIKETVTASENENADTDSGSSETTEDETVDEGLHISPNAVFAYTRDEWNAFTFTVLTNASEQTVYIWDFGDGVTSSKPTVQHVYNTSGAFPVKLTTTDESGIVSSESTTVLVPFFHLKNRLVLASVVLLMLLLLVGIASFVRLGKKTSPHA
ncbi:MAG TPA: PKD domain-containing protein [Patescibacteria group bacterium]|nr:PKD domain-containing protein [Patescibacteria group bacterium]